MFMGKTVCHSLLITTDNSSARKIYGDYLSQLPCKNELSKAILDKSRSQHYDCANAYAVLPKENFTVPCHIVLRCISLYFSTIPLSERMPHLRALRI
jgi:hypothetical protein